VSGQLLAGTPGAIASKQAMRAENGDANETARRLSLMVVGGREERREEGKGSVATIQERKQAKGKPRAASQERATS